MRMGIRVGEVSEDLMRIVLKILFGVVGLVGGMEKFFFRLLKFVGGLLVLFRVFLGVIFRFELKLSGGFWLSWIGVVFGKGVFGKEVLDVVVIVVVVLIILLEFVVMVICCCMLIFVNDLRIDFFFSGILLVIWYGS